jgi:hypothetical protein
MHLAVSFAGKKNAFLGPMDQKLWMFEVSWRSLGMAGMCWSQPARVDHLRKNWREKIQEKWEQPNTYACQAVPIFLIFLIFFKKNFWKFGKWAKAFGRMGIQHPHYLSLPLHLEVLILPKFVESGDFTFFQKRIFLNLEHTWAFISTIGIFVS